MHLERQIKLHFAQNSERIKFKFKNNWLIIKILSAGDLITFKAAVPILSSFYLAETLNEHAMGIKGYLCTN